MYTCSPNTQEVEAGGDQKVKVVEASLEYMRPYLKKKKKRKDGEENEEVEEEGRGENN